MPARPPPPSARASRLILIGLLLLGLLGLGASVWALQGGLATRGWTPVDGTVVGVAVRRDLNRRAVVTDEASRERQSTFKVELRYRWAVQGRSYLGTRHAIGDGNTVSRHGQRAEAEAAARAWQLGAPVRVFVDPKDPAQAVLKTGPEAILWVFVGITAAWVAALLMVLWRQGQLARAGAA
jgi:hypothetical protein